MNTEGVLRYFDQRLDAYGVDVRAVDWGSEASQALRFRVLCAVGDLDGRRVLDVGSGLGDLCRYLGAHHPTAVYEGCDVNPRMVAAARARFPAGRFLVADPLGEARALRPPYDWVLASGLFYLRDEAFMEAMVRRLFDLCARGLAFNTLSAWAARREPGELHAEPARVLALARALAPRLVLRHDYLPNDFTVYLYRDG